MMAAVYIAIGVTVVWIAAAVAICLFAAVSVSLWRDRAHIRWPWQRRRSA